MVRAFVIGLLLGLFVIVAVGGDTVIAGICDAAPIVIAPGAC